jgi:sulfite reductase (NADPH) flavoprotein alpha-component
MAAMGQLDCGQCGYLCQSYAERWRKGARRRRRCACRAPSDGADGEAIARRGAGRRTAGGRDGTGEAGHPDVRVVSAAALTGPGSTKDVRHVVIDLAASGLTYEPGDSIGLATPNDPILVEACLAALGASGDEMVAGPDGVERSLRETFTVSVDIARPLDRTTDLLAMSAKHPRHAAALCDC